MSGTRVSDLMCPCALQTIQEDTTLRQAARIVLQTGLETLPVTGPRGELVGLVAQSALIRELMRSHSSTDTVRPIVSRHVESARDTAEIDAVLPLFRCAAVTLIPVVDRTDRPVGLVHRRDVIRYLLGEERTDAERGWPDHRAAGGPYFLSDRSTTAESRTADDAPDLPA